LFAACSGGDTEAPAKDAAPDVDFWDVDVAPIKDCPTYPPYDGEQCYVKGLKCVVPCDCASGRRGYQAYCSPISNEWNSHPYLCCGYSY